MTSRHLRRPRRAVLTAHVAVTALAAATLASLASPAQAASGTFTQPAPITVEHEGEDRASGDATTALPIPDGGGASSSISLSAPANAPATWIESWAHLTHANQDDVDLVLVAPNGKAVTLASDIGGNNAIDGWVNFYTYYDSFSDDGNCTSGCYGSPTDWDTTPGDVDVSSAPADISALGSPQTNGTWTLWAYDDTTGNTGQVDDWGLDVYYAKQAPASDLTVAGLPNSVTDVNLVLNDVTGYIGDTEFVLESPDGRRAHVLSDAVDDDDLTGQDLTLDDEAAQVIPRYSMPQSGSYRPRNYDDDDQFEPVAGVDTNEMDARLSTFDGGAANGTWKLWVSTQWCCSTVTVGSWSLQVTSADLPAAPVVTSPTSGARLASTSVTLSGTAVAGAVVRVTEGGRTQSTVADGGSWTLTRSGLKDGSHTFGVTQTTSAGTSAATNVTVVVDTKAPKVGKTNPKDGAKGVKTSVSPTVKFSEAMKAKSLKKSVKLMTAGGKKVDAKLKWNAKKRTLTLNPKKDLAGKARYELVVKKSARDLAGNKLAKGKTVGFTTG